MEQWEREKVRGGKKERGRDFVTNDFGACCHQLSIMDSSTEKVVSSLDFFMVQKCHQIFVFWFFHECFFRPSSSAIKKYMPFIVYCNILTSNTNICRMEYIGRSEKAGPFEWFEWQVHHTKSCNSSVYGQCLIILRVSTRKYERRVKRERVGTAQIGGKYAAKIYEVEMYGKCTLLKILRHFYGNTRK